MDTTFVDRWMEHRNDVSQLEALVTRDIVVDTMEVSATWAALPLIYERARAWLARLRGRPDPGPVDYRRLVPVSVGVFALLVGVGLLLIMADIVNPVHILQ